MPKCVIFCAGSFDGLAAPIEKDDYIIAADGGLHHVESLGIPPHAVLGDFDSLGYVPAGAEVFPVEKDDTDSMLAVRKALALGYQEIWIYGGLDGARLDHTLSNLQVLQYLANQGAVGYLIGLTAIATVVQEEAITFPKGAEGILSAFCVGPDATGVTITSLQYPMKNGALTAAYPLGVSNHFIGEEATISVERGSLLLLYPKEVGFPTGRCKI